MGLHSQCIIEPVNRTAELRLGSLLRRSGRASRGVVLRQGRRPVVVLQVAAQRDFALRASRQRLGPGMEYSPVSASTTGTWATWTASSVPASASNGGGLSSDSVRRSLLLCPLDVIGAGIASCRAGLVDLVLELRGPFGAECPASLQAGAAHVEHILTTGVFNPDLVPLPSCASIGCPKN